MCRSIKVLRRANETVTDGGVAGCRAAVCAQDQRLPQAVQGESGSLRSEAFAKWPRPAASFWNRCRCDERAAVARTCCYNLSLHG